MNTLSESEIKYDKEFLKRLLEKLSVGNARSIHLNAVPGRINTRLDITDIVFGDSRLDLQFTDDLTSKTKFSFPINWSLIDLSNAADADKNGIARTSKKLDNIFFENSDRFLETGIKPFGFGFPLLIKSGKNDPEKVIKAPIFIWSLDIEKSNRKNEWTVKRNEDHDIRINDLLISHIKQDEGIDIDKIALEDFDNPILNKEYIVEYIKKLLKQLNSLIESTEFAVRKCPEAKQIERIHNGNAWIQWSGIFGLYHSPKQVIIEATEKLNAESDNFNNEKLLLEDFQKYKAASFETDPSQREVIDNLTSSEFKLIQGPPGTGKSQAISAILSNALSSGAKTLVVCEKKTALDVIFQNMKQKALDEYCIIIDDVHSSRRAVIEKARAICDNSKNFTDVYNDNFKSEHDSFIKLRKEINSKFKAASEKILNGYTWKDIIGLFLKHSRNKNFMVLKENLKHIKINFDKEKLDIRRNLMQDAVSLYSGIPNDSNSYFVYISKKDTSISYMQEVQDAIVNLKDILNTHIKSIEKLSNNLFKEQFIKGQNANKIIDVDVITEIIEKLQERIEEIKLLFYKGEELIGKEFYLPKLSFLKTFLVKKYAESSRMQKTIRDYIKDCFERFNDLQEQGVNIAWENDIFEKKFMEKINKNIDIMTQKIQSINDIFMLYKKLYSTISKLKAASNNVFTNELYKHIVSLQTSNLGNKDYYSKQFTDIQNRLTWIEDKLPCYDSYIKWNRFLSASSDFIKYCLTVFMKFEIETEHWNDIVKAFYLYKFILDFDEKTSSNFHKNDSEILLLRKRYIELQKLNIENIRSVFSKKRNNSIKNMNISSKILFNLKKGKKVGALTPLRKLGHDYFELLTDIFPIILSNPVAANSLFPLKQGLFDIIIFDEASQLRIEDVFTSMIRGKYKIIAGDDHQMPPSSYFATSVDVSGAEVDTENMTTEEYEEWLNSNEQAASESLLAWASKRKKISKSSLDFHYRSRHPSLIDFSNAAFYGSNLCPLPENKEYTPIILKDVNGVYADRANETEVHEVLSYLVNLKPDTNGEYPSIGIATLNINQRNSINNAIYEYAASNSNFNRKIEKLLGCKDGFFVKNLENIQGDEKDIIIISTTFGRTKEGKFSENFGPINREVGYKLLNVLVTRARQQVIVFTSIPQEKYMSYNNVLQELESNNRKGVFYAYLAYAKAISENNTDSASSVLRQLESFCNEPKRNENTYQSSGLSESPFEEEVYQELIEHLPKESIIQQYQVGGYRLDFLLKINDRNIALECDGKTYHSSDQAYAYDIHRQTQLEKLGYEFFRIWSTNWFAGKEREIDKLLQYIKNRKNPPPPPPPLTTNASPERPRRCRPCSRR
jgi:superfamily I DNA and/or RNA helicase/very-short-patch-repair endonuclease